MTVIAYDPTASDDKSRVRGIGRYLQILRENLPDWQFSGLPLNYFPLIPLNVKFPTTFIHPFFSFITPPLIMKRIAKKQIAVIHDLIPLKYQAHFPIGLKGQLNVFLNKLALKNYDLIVTDSLVSKKDIVQILRVNPDIVKIIYPCLPKAFSIKYQVLSNAKLNTNYSILNTNFCLYVGDATWNKNLVNLARAIKLQDTPCVFVGKVFEKLVASSKYQVLSNKKINTNYSILNTNNNPWNRELKEFQQLSRDDKRFVFAGFIPDSELLKLYQQARLNLLLSRDEGFGFSYLEAASQGCVSLLANRPIFHEVAGKSALFVDPENPQDIAEKIKEVIKNQEIITQYSSLVRENYQKYSNSQFTSQWSGLIS